MTVKESVNNRSLTSDLIPKKEWLHKNKIIENTGLDKLLAPINHTLTEKHQQLEQKLKEVQGKVDESLDKYKLELALKLQEYGLEYGRMKNYLDEIIRKKDITEYMQMQPEYIR